MMETQKTFEPPGQGAWYSTWCFVTHDLVCHIHGAFDLASPQSRDEARRVSAGPRSQLVTEREAQSCVRRVT